MKKAKIILGCVAILSVVGGALAFKASREPANVYSLQPGNKVASIMVSGVVYTTTIPNCTLTDLRSTNDGIEQNVRSTTTDPLSTTIFRSGSNQVVATFPYCTLWVTEVIPAND